MNWRFLPHDLDVSTWIDPKPLAQARERLASKLKKEGAAQAAPTI